MLPCQNGCSYGAETFSKLYPKLVYSKLIQHQRFKSYKNLILRVGKEVDLAKGWSLHRESLLTNYLTSTKIKVQGQCNPKTKYGNIAKGPTKNSLKKIVYLTKAYKILISFSKMVHTTSLEFVQGAFILISEKSHTFQWLIGPSYTWHTKKVILYVSRCSYLTIPYQLL